MEYKIFQFVDHTLAFASATSSGRLSEKSFVLFIQYPSCLSRPATTLKFIRSTCDKSSVELSTSLTDDLGILLFSKPCSAK